MNKSPQFEALTRKLRESGWQPVERLLCGCNPRKLCPGHAEQRAVEHYHPEAIR